MEIAAGKFKAECLKLMDRVNETHEEIIISKRGVPVARLVPVSVKPERNIFGMMKNSITTQHDIVSGTGEHWDADE